MSTAAVPHANLALCWCQMTPIHWYIRHGQGQQVIDVIRAYHASYPAMIYQPDALGATPIDVATQVYNQQAVDTIRELDAINRRVSEQVTTRRHGVGVGVATPIEAKLQALLRLAKIRRDGYSPEELALEYNNHRAQGMPGNLDDYIKQRRWGCTCGACSEGWMSPRMRFRIGSAAEYISDLMADVHADEFPQTGGAHPSPDDLYPDVPSKLHPHVTLQFWNGYSILFDTIGILLHGTELPLTEAAVLKLSHRKLAVEYFLEKGGQFAHAIDATMDMAWEESSRSDGLFEEVHADDNEYNGLPTCKNDLNFELVRDRLGLPPDVVHGDDYGDGDGHGFALTLSGGLDRVMVIEDLLRRHRAGEF